MPKVSVIIPVYGVEQYIERCAISLFEQTLEDIEFIFVDDCTKDRSIVNLQKVLDKYPQRKGQTKIVHHEHNMGLPQARKTGVLVAKGSFIAHCDSDDWVDRDMYRSMYERAQVDKSDLVICDFIRTNDKDYTEVEKGCHTIDVNCFGINVLYHKDSWSLCNKLIKHSLYDEVVFPEKNMGEDMALFLQIMTKVTKISYDSSVSYYYFFNSLSITKKKTAKQIYENFKQVIENVRIVLKHYENSDDMKTISGLNYLKWSQKAVILPLTHQKHYYSIWRNTFPDVEKEILFDRNQCFRDRLKCLLIILHVYPWSRKNRV